MKEQFVRLAADCLEGEKFRLLDIGCSGGIDPAWRAFGPQLQALGIDASETECRRLTEQEGNPEVSYVAAFVGRSARKSGPSGRHLALRMSFWRTLQARRAQLQGASTEEKMRHNVWQMTGLADPDRVIAAPDLLSERDWTSLDYFKIDIDGPDLEVLQSFASRFDALGILAVQTEVNFTDTPGSGLFRDTDRFLSDEGFSLFRLDPRTYSMAALPARFATTAPAQTVSGRLYQGEAYYARDPVASNKAMSTGQLLKLASIFSVWDQPDSAAEILVTFRERLAPLVDVDAALDLLATQTQAGTGCPLSYRDYMAQFAADAPLFYPPPPLPPWQPPPRPTFVERLQAAWHSVSDWSYIEKLMNDLKERRRS